VSTDLDCVRISLFVLKVSTLDDWKRDDLHDSIQQKQVPADQQETTNNIYDHTDLMSTIYQ
jgi:hypothetical protein